ncbi:hypothetical protein [Dyadobacter jiangsuensis]|uniref:Uracil DNA glycosylase superfamily protein n=1 Tax=Dyadobacter jiangsuensis TaxID=1591085 RepID=A0A2P8G0C5_9BACT|nr:hypothetical protein [Dyadobacter jiangsuensis]PSL27419.1 hypothetical protein CLV60_108277 [Dyadobacter jiangsuensis]
MQPTSLFDQFSALYTSEKLGDHDRPIIKDGIIHAPTFEKQSKRILFIAKEHNLGTDGGSPDFAADYGVWWQNYVYKRFAHRLSEWAYGILNDFPEDFHSISKEERLEALRSIALINVKKSSGTAAANAAIIAAYIAKSKALLQQQIMEIRPTLIVCCFRYDNYPNDLFGETDKILGQKIEMKKHSSNLYSRGLWNGLPVINFFHPSARKSKQFLYTELANALSYATDY